MEYVADQLGHSLSVLAGYGTERTRWDHQNAIKDAYGYTGLKGDAWWKLARWLWDRCWSGNERPIALFVHQDGSLQEGCFVAELTGLNTS